MAATNSSWNRGSVAVSILVTRAGCRLQLGSLGAATAGPRRHRHRRRCRPSARRRPGSRAPGRAPCARSGSMWAPNAPARRTSVDHRVAGVLDEQVDAGAQRGLGELDRPHVVLGDGQAHTVALVEHVGERAPVGRRPGGCAPPGRPGWRRRRRRSRPRYISAMTSMIPEPQTPVIRRRRSRPRRTTRRSRSPAAAARASTGRCARARWRRPSPADRS